MTKKQKQAIDDAILMELDGMIDQASDIADFVKLNSSETVLPSDVETRVKRFIKLAKETK